MVQVGSNNKFKNGKLFILCIFVKNMDKQQLISNLLAEVERKIGRTLRTPTDFQYLSLQISKEGKGYESLSISTIKRLYKYINSSHEPSQQTLTILAHFIGYKDWDTFRRFQSTLAKQTSGFLSNIDDVLTKTKIGDTLYIQWNPNRKIKVQNQGSRRVIVIASENSQLIVGDSFKLSEIKNDKPLLATDFIRDGMSMPDYIMGRNDGVNVYLE